MSPLLDLQLRLRQNGTLRMGELVTRNGKTFPTTRTTWRVTTSDRKIADQVAELFGGTVEPFESKSTDALKVDTDVDALPIAVVPGHALTQWYELWSGGGCQRRCDGYEELISDGPCLCTPEARECEPTTRLSLILRGIDALGLFRLNTGGWYAAAELGGAVQFLEQRTAAGESLEGWLRIEPRKVIRDGKTQTFSVPVLDVVYGLDRLLPAATGGQRGAGLPYGYKPAPAAIEAGTSTAAGLAAVESPEDLPRTGRSAEPIPRHNDEFGSPVPVPVPAEGGTPGEPHSAPHAVESQTHPADEAPASVSSGDPATLALTAPQAKKLNVLVGQLREAGHITTEQLWAAMAKERNVPAETMVTLFTGRDGEGVLHWSPLRDSLTRLEARNLIERLQAYQEGKT